MIHTAKQLKDKVKNLSGGRSNVAQTLIRTYIMERFLERVSFMATCNKRGTDFSREDIEEVLEQVISDRGLQDMWGRFRENYFFVGLIEWSEIIEADVEYIKRLLIS